MFHKHDVGYEIFYFHINIDGIFLFLKTGNKRTLLSSILGAYQSQSLLPTCECKSSSIYWSIIYVLFI